MKKLAPSQTHPWFVVLLLRRAFVFICLVIVATLGTSGCSQSPTGGSGGSGGTDASAGATGGNSGTDAGTGATGGTGGAGGAGAPRLFFSDLTSGPKTGWEGSATKGAAISVWGENFGSARGSNYITINGAKLTSKLDYAEWGVTKNSARGLERITFWLNDKAADGAGKITVTVTGLTSNTLPFTVRSGNIYFINNSDTKASNSNNGKYNTYQSGTNGPWLSINQADPGRYNKRLLDGDIVYVSGGPYGGDVHGDSSGWSASEGRPVATVGYPGEFPEIQGQGGLHLYNGYYGVHKLLFTNPVVPFSNSGSAAIHFRMVGDIFLNNTENAWSGILDSSYARYWKLYGLIFKNTGYDYYKHAIYIRSVYGETHDIDIGWSEFNNYRSDLGTPGTSGSGMINLRDANSKGWVIYNVYIHDNLFKDSPTATVLYNEEFGMHDIYFYNNIMSNVGHEGDGVCVGVINLTNGGPYYIYNNTVYNSGSSNNGYVKLLRIAGDKYYIRNNIFYSINGQKFFYDKVGAVYADNNVFYGNTAPVSGNGLQVTNSITSNPLFVDPASHDFHLKKNSPVIGVGTSGVGSVVKKDYDGISRPQPAGGDYDIGAYEYQSK